MKSTLALLALVGSSAASLLTPEYVEANHGALWASFKQTHSRNYTSASEEAARKGIFKLNMMKAAATQARNPMAQFGATPFADLTEEEFRPYTHGMAHHLPTPNMAKAALFTENEIRALGSSVDWRTKGAVTAVKNQAQCGSCWAFSTTGVTEGQNFLHGDGKLTSLSEQEFVSCDSELYGCSGGLPSLAYSWAISENNGKVVTEDAYPYTSGEGSVAKCKKTKKMPVGATIKSSTTIDSNEEQMAAWLVQNGPISIGVNAADDWQMYTGGVLSNCAATQPDHAVLIVGVTADYWIVKNSWATVWGENGYIRLAFGSNQCNIKYSPTAPQM